MENNNSNDKLFAILAYLGPLFLVGLFLGKDSKFVRYHVNQGLILFIFDIIIGIIVSFGSWIPVIGWLFGLLYLVVAVLAILGILNAVRDQESPLPFIGGFELIK